MSVCRYVRYSKDDGGTSWCALNADHALTEQIAKRDARIAELEAALRAVRADRPSAHSDEVWRVIVAALGTEPQP